MGYSDLSVGGADEAFDAAYDVIDCMVKNLRRSLRTSGNEFNPSGTVNVAMIFDEIIMPSKYLRKDGGLCELARETRDRLKKEIQHTKKSDPVDWEGGAKSGAANKRWHLNKYQYLEKRLSRFCLDEIR